MVSQCTKFEVSRFTRYEAINGDAKCRKWGGLELLQGTQSHGKPFDRAHTTSYLTLIETMRLSYTVFEIQPVICRKSPILTHSTCIWRPRRGGVIPVKFRRDLWRQKTSPWAIVWCCLCDPTFSCFSRTPTCDRRADDRQTQQTNTGPWLVPRMHSIAR